ncbi:hypothetical protein NS354_09910 [Leucobacter chromiiresistens]|uniref:Uncharacterized protein n=1 Tax=Leucobacter chromiiresistens TaxID=1079994 RepID=A0A147EJW8_9MICO|nr:hypothetical protein NS354_09910 [Leucobacter chromiiresistens]
MSSSGSAPAAPSTAPSKPATTLSPANTPPAWSAYATTTRFSAARARTSSSGTYAESPSMAVGTSSRSAPWAAANRAGSGNSMS